MDAEADGPIKKSSLPSSVCAVIAMESLVSDTSRKLGDFTKYPGNYVAYFGVLFYFVTLLQQVSRNVFIYL